MQVCEEGRVIVDDLCKVICEIERKSPSAIKCKSDELKYRNKNEMVCDLIKHDEILLML